MKGVHSTGKYYTHTDRVGMPSTVKGVDSTGKYYTHTDRVGMPATVKGVDSTGKYYTQRQGWDASHSEGSRFNRKVLHTEMGLGCQLQ